MKRIIIIIASIIMVCRFSYSLEQPTSIPGSFNILTQPLPALADIMAKADPDLPVYGLYCGTSEFRMFLTQINQVGWKSIRLGGTLSDVEMLFICQNGFEIMHTLGATKRDDEASDDAFLLKELAHYRDQVTRYGPDGTFFTERPTLPKVPVKHWEIRNEPNFQYMYEAGTEAQREALYAKLLPAACDTIKHYSPQSSVVGFGCGGSGAGDTRFIQHVHENNTAVAGSYDILSTHPYQVPTPPETYSIRGWGSYSTAGQLAGIRSLMETHNAQTDRIWYTEVGWRISQEEGGTYATSADNDITQRLQAAYVTRLYALAMRLGVERVHNMYITDADGFNGGFFNSDKSFRESATAVQNMIKVLPLPKITGAVSDGVSGYYAYTFNPDVQLDFTIPVTMAWNVAGPRTVDLPANSGKTYEVIDMLGAVTEQTASSATMSVEIGPCPVYVREKGDAGISYGSGSRILEGYSVKLPPRDGELLFEFRVGYRTDVRLDIFDAAGRNLHACIYKYTRPGTKQVRWQAPRGSGVYFYRITHETRSDSGRTVLVR